MASSHHRLFAIRTTCGSRNIWKSYCKIVVFHLFLIVSCFDFSRYIYINIAMHLVIYYVYIVKIMYLEKIKRLSI
jgi:hypothetical protein